jgi:DNA topoisomerase-6 subunit B
LIEPNKERAVFPRAVEVNPARPIEIKPHPLGITTHDLLEFARNSTEKKVSLFLQTSFSRVSSAKVAELSAAIPDVDFGKKPADLSWEEAEKIVKSFAAAKWIAPSTDTLVPIGKEQIEKSFTNIFNPEVLVVTERSPKVYRGGIPFMVEASVAYGGGLVSAEKKGEVMRFSNRVPLLFDSSGCAITETIKSIDWKRYDIRAFDEEPIAILVNLISVHVPYTSAGKQAISQEEDVMIEIKNAVMEASRSVQKYLSGKRKASEIANKKKVVSRYIQQLSSDLAGLSGEKRQEIEKMLSKIIEEKYAFGETEEEVPLKAEEEVEEDKGGDE